MMGFAPQNDAFVGDRSTTCAPTTAQEGLRLFLDEFVSKFYDRLLKDLRVGELVPWTPLELQGPESWRPNNA